MTSAFTDAELDYLRGERRLARITSPSSLVRIHPARVVSWGLRS